MDYDTLDFEFDLPPPTPVGPALDNSDDLTWPPGSPESPLPSSAAYLLESMGKALFDPITPISSPVSTSPPMERQEPIPSSSSSVPKRVFRPISPIEPAVDTPTLPEPSHRSPVDDSNKKIKSVIVSEVPKRTWSRVPMVSGKDARHRLNSISASKKDDLHRRKKDAPASLGLKNDSQRLRKDDSQRLRKDDSQRLRKDDSQRLRKDDSPKPQIPERLRRDNSPKPRISERQSVVPSTSVSRMPPPSSRPYNRPRSFYRNRSYGKKVHMHEKCLGVICIQDNGYSLTNGSKTISFDGHINTERLLGEVITLKVGHLLTADEETHKTWKTIVGQQNEMHPDRHLEVMKLMLKTPLGNCLFCGRQCHRFKVITGGFCQISHVPLDVVPH